MFIKMLVKKLNFMVEKGRNKEPEEIKYGPINPDLAKSIEMIKENLGSNGDIKIHEIHFGENEEIKAAIVYIDGMVNNNLVSESILKPLLTSKGCQIRTDDGINLDYLKKNVICIGDMTEKDNYNDLFDSVLNGDTVLIIDGVSNALGIDTKGWEIRNITEPQTESVVRGPREGFTENLRTNTTMIRRKIRNSGLKMENMKIGRKTRTDVVIAYIDGVVKKELLETVKKRLKNIKVDAILDAGYIEEFIEDSPLSIFSTVGYTEKPDVAAAKILEGRIGIVVDGSPFVLTVPMFFVEGFQMSEDYYTKSVYASLTRMMRMAGYLIAIFAIPFYIAFTTYHHELIPTKLLMSLINAKEGTPFPVFFETLIMVVAFEILREAGLRLPRAIGQAISIVGALIIGEATVAAGLVGTAVVITVALSAVASYIVPTQAESISMLRIIMMFLAAFLGGFGIVMGFIVMLISLARLKSFGTPYLGMTDPNRNFQDSFMRSPLWLMSKRPIDLAGKDKTRLKPFKPPKEQ